MTEGNDRSGTEKLIDENLKRVFQSISDEELPERLKSLLEELRAQDSAPTGASETVGRESDDDA